MIISQITLLNFRNHKKRNFSFSPDLTIVVGKNTSGKTNLMEAVYLLSTARSFRHGRDYQTITFNREMARIKGLVGTDDETKELEITLTRGEVTGIKTPLKKFTINGVSKRSIDFVGILPSVLFWPEDMELVTGSPTIRRHYLDSVLIQIDREYRRTLNSYERALRQRNKLLEAIRENQADRQQLLFWDQLLIKQGNYLTGKREEFISSVNETELPALLKTGAKYMLYYDKSIISHLRFDQLRPAEIASAVTLVGPHRDDMIFKIRNPDIKSEENETEFENPNNYKDLSLYGSRGEQRLAVLWLKLSELRYMQKETGERAVLLLDDIFSELDHEHREIIFKILPDQQSILTVTDKHLIPEERFRQAKVIELSGEYE
ncbi:hypothetical protein A3D05_02095 [Candidatus Gottesmanbacteria bacterium RIFCSPHIGHO2_02_FULL_40_24]|nr:MAG: hypothetical protein A3D05_02095 [Candidatus Gottesmanbacteria bacterium RIFCSPHIGHO2_02_FULL_40_24]OGG22810.1 MAG: hypothetical protein A3B48_05470 [Candidatus Gottesmanbacteria bacterium RIFCSPLOWO2_01_FULL_40_10]OGG24956.1 MAG: hypothetical protein A3E42_02900 [Candidatus Gottesmanbacteria bacterium RIFCSPHIGHO2_12_FULL_40_13]OGG31861.1 MAG: hypothetical protein A3I80_02435 [Candidatus Gottesmanbacteria bacterium RIFCSPLOWO2_02_FULL_40_10]